MCYIPVDLTTNNDDEKVENLIYTMAVDFLDDVLTLKMRIKIILNHIQVRMIRKNIYLHIILNFSHHKISPCLVLHITL